MDEMQICTIRDLMQKSGCQTLKEFEEYLALSQDMDEMEKAENEYKAALAELKAALENEETAEQMQELLSMPEVSGFLDGTDQLLQVGDALKRLAQGDHDAKTELLDASEKLPDALQKMDWLSDDPEEEENTSKELTNALQELNDALADEPLPEDPVQEQHIRDIAADIREMLTQLTDDAEMRACIGADTADAGARELREALRRLERREEEQIADN